jgi:hypothetical protein
MRTLALVVLLSATALAFTIINNCGASQDYVNALDTYLQKAYDMYTQDVKTPTLCPNFYVELRNDVQYPAATYSQIGPLGACAYKMVFRCDVSQTWLQHLAFHEMAHALQNAVSGKGYGWWSEAHAEGLATYYMVVRIYQAGQWQRYGYVQDFWDKQLYKQDPWQCIAPNLCAYEYGAFFTWLAWKYSPLNATLTYALPMDRLRMAYINFLLSPWSWGRDPTYLDFDQCVGAQVSPNSALYCTYSPVLPNRVYVFSSTLFINATGLSDKILLALVATKTATADPSVTVSYCYNPTATVTTTVTATQTATQTVTKTETYTVTYTTTVTVPTTYTTTATYTTPVTTTVTVTVPTTTTVTSTTTYTVTVPVTETKTVTSTVTMPVTVTSTETVTETTTSIVTTTVVATYTTTSTVTTTVPTTTTLTVTTTVAEGGVPTSLVVIAVVVALLVGCYLCGRAAKTDIKTLKL